MPDLRIFQLDHRPERAQRLAERRQRYGYSHASGFPVATGFCDDDQPPRSWQVRALAAQEQVRLHLLQLQRQGRWNFVNPLPPLSPRRLVEMLRAGDVGALTDYFMPVPGGSAGSRAPATLLDYRAISDLLVAAEPPPSPDDGDSDAYFAEMAVAGPDPTRLVRLDAVPAKFPLTSQHLSAVPGLGSDLAAAIAAGRVYWIDHQAMADLNDGRHPQAAKYIYAPMVAFAVPAAGASLRPFAIQCGQDPAGRTIYTPADGASWRMAKVCAAAAHNTYHEVLTHLGFTHLISEAILVAALRTLAPQHPIAVLLRRHFEGTMSINKLAVELLIQPGKAVEYLIGSDLPSTYPFLARHRRAFSFRGNALPARLAAAGTDRAAALPDFPYRDDGRLIWDAIASWMTDFVAGFYASDGDVRADRELQAWAAEVSAVDGGAVRDFGATPGAIADRNDLVEILTMTIWTAGPQHAAVNFSQKDHLAFLPANPLAGFSAEPRGRGHTDGDWLAQLPPLDVAVHQACVMTFLSAVHHGVLGDYQDDFVGTPVADAQRRFAQRLSTIEDEIVARNTRRRRPYPYLRPSLIPNSTNI